jgi:RHS repeat-associated protein
MKYVGGNFSQVGASGTVKNHFITDPQMQNKPATKSGYVYIYCSNESNANVFFDNLQVFHTLSPILKETHYYPFGLVMAGISSKAATTLENKYKYNGKELQSKEFSDGGGLEWLDYGARMYDAQVGRWSAIDPHVANYYWLSPYNYCNLNPLKYSDPSGMDPEPKVETLPTVVVSTILKPKNSSASWVFGWANEASTKESKQWQSERSVYEQARNNGFSKEQMQAHWRKHGITEDKLKSYETGWQAEQDGRNMQLIAVGAFAAPVVAVEGGFVAAGAVGTSGISSAVSAIGTGARSFFSANKHRFIAMASDVSMQYYFNTVEYGLGLTNIKNINYIGVVASGALPGNSLLAHTGSAIIGNAFSSNLDKGYRGVGSGVTSTVIGTNIALDFIGNRIGGVGGELIGNGTQTIFNAYYNLNNPEQK